MAVTLTHSQLSAALRLGDSGLENAEANRLLAYATEAVNKHAPDAPEATANESVVRLAAYLFNRPDATRGDSFAFPLRSSGAGSLLAPYREHRAGVTA